jgi:YggT family protein
VTAFVEAFGLLLRVLEAAILVRVLYSWVDPNPYPTNTFKRLLWALTDPILEPLRRVIPPVGMLDISPVVALIALQVLGQVVASLASPTGF